jgi:hypothetical protein
MATVAEIEQQIASLRARLGALEDATIAVRAEIERLQFQAVDLRSAARRQREGGDIAGADALRAQAQALDDKAAALYNSPAFKNLEAAESEIRRLENELYNAQQKAKNDEYQNNQPKEQLTAEQKIAQQKAAEESDRTTPVVNKPAPVPEQSTGDKTPAPTAEKPSQTQQPIAQDDNPQTQNQGATAPGPQGPANTSSGAKTSGSLNTNTEIVPQPNVLDRFASYTWQASVYLMSTKQYTQLLRSKKKSINGYNLLFQSGGAPPNTGGFLGKLGPGQQSSTGGDGSVSTAPPGGVLGTNSVDRGRNPAFPLDFYIESVTIDNMLPGRQTKSPHMVTNMKFTVIEPGNITLLDRLYEAVQDMGQVGEKDQPINYTSAAYLMVLRWYGYDENGNLVPVGAADPNTGLTDPNAVVEKFIPFLITQIKWQVSSKLVSYDFECAPINQMVAGGTRRGTIPYDVQLTDGNVGKLLGGDLVYASTAPPAAPANAPGSPTTANTDSSGRRTAANDPRSTTFQTQRVPDRPTQASVRAVDNAIDATGAPAKANAASSARNTIKEGLTGAMNAFQQQLVRDGIYKVADTYEIVFVADKQGHQPIRDAKITKYGKVKDQTQTPMKPGATQVGSQAFNEAANVMDITNRNWSITAGMQMVQAIDLAIRNSTYITDQALTEYDETSGAEIPNAKVTINAENPMKWFQISMEAQQGDYDEARNDYAYNIKFVISPYELAQFDSKYFPLTKFRGVHKSYPYWFTGQNSAVLDFTANFNSLYNITVTGTHADQSAAAQQRKKFTASMRDIPKYTYAPASNASRQGASGKGNEVSASASEYLYSPGDMGIAKVRIIGDPAWIQQGSLAGGVNTAEFGYSAFLPDGTINFDASQVMFEIAWQRPEDYNLSTGLADPYARPGNQARQPQQSNVYKAYKVVSEFKSGKFEQTLEGSLYYFPIPSRKNTAASAPNQSAAEDSRLARQNTQATATRTNTAPATDSTAANTDRGFTADQLRAKSTAARLSGTLLSPSAIDAVTSAAAAGGSSLPAPDISNLPPALAAISNGQIVSTSVGGLGSARLFNNAPGKITKAAVPNRTQSGARDY